MEREGFHTNPQGGRGVEGIGRSARNTDHVTKCLLGEGARVGGGASITAATEC